MSISIACRDVDIFFFAKLLLASWMGNICEQYFWSEKDWGVGFDRSTSPLVYRAVWIVSLSTVTSALCGCSAGRWTVFRLHVLLGLQHYFLQVFLHPSICPSISIYFPVPVVNKHLQTQSRITLFQIWNMPEKWWALSTRVYMLSIHVRFMNSVCYSSISVDGFLF